MFRIIFTSFIFLIVSNVCLAQFSRNVIVSTGGLSLSEQLEKERQEAEKAAEAERLAQEEAEKKAAEAERQKAAEEARIKAEQKAEAERKAAEEARIKAEQKAEAERIAAEEARIKAEQKAEAERIAAEEARIKAKKKAEEEKQKAAEREQRKQERKARIASYPWSHMIMVNAGLSSSPDYAFGLTYAYVKHAGFYVSAMSNFGFKFNAKYDALSDGSLRYHENNYHTYNYDNYQPFYTGKTDYTRLEATVGGMVRLRIPLYAYAGVGYGYRGLYCEVANGEWVRLHNNSTVYHGAVVEAGLTGNIKGFLISAGYSVYISDGVFHQAKLGVGYCF